jgi:hypothetical protein
MYAWATPDYILNHMSLEQVMLYYSKGWNSKKRGAVILWGVLGQALQGKDPEGTGSRYKGIQGLEDFRKDNPGETLDNGAWRVSR